MKVTYSSKKEYILNSEEGTFLGSLKFEKWSSSKAQMTTQFGEFYDFLPKGFWGTSIVVSKGDSDIAELKMNWKGQIVIDMLETEQKTDYLTKSHNIWKSQYALVDPTGTELLIITPDYKWTQGHYDFKIDVNPHFTEQIDETLVLIAVYSVLYYLMMQAAAAAS
ncbi:MAG: hypothetical protein JNL70_03685 [Saprospiraceae bacterium]|nr:hypothetical protein [Saprospiraceae bacterium]